MRQILARLEETETAPSGSMRVDYQEAVRAAVKMLKLPTEKQISVQASLLAAGQPRLGNAGRVILLSRFRSNAHIHDVAASLARELKDHNAKVTGGLSASARRRPRPAESEEDKQRVREEVSAEEPPIDHCELLCMHVNPLNDPNDTISSGFANCAKEGTL